jgi:hypothetical protein
LAVFSAADRRRAAALACGLPSGLVARRPMRGPDRDTAKAREEELFAAIRPFLDRPAASSA